MEEIPHIQKAGVLMVLELSLKGPVGAGKPISLSFIRGKLEDAAGSFSGIHFTITSKGGDFDESFAIYTMLRAMPCPIAATAIGECFSGALLVFLGAALRKAKAGTEFLIHPTSRGRDSFPDRVTADFLQKQADELAKIDERVVDLFVDRTGYAREFFEREKTTEDTLDIAAVIESGIAHEVEGLTPPCDPAWPDALHRIAREAGHCVFPLWMKTAAYAEAARTAAFFPQTAKTSERRPPVQDEKKLRLIS